MLCIKTVNDIIRNNYWIVEHICFMVVRIVVDPGAVYFAGRT